MKAVRGGPHEPVLKAAGGGGRDIIVDFESGADVIDLLGVDADSNCVGNQGFDFIATAFSGSGAELRIIDQGGRALLQADIDGDANADFEILIYGDAPLESDFALKEAAPVLDLETLPPDLGFIIQGDTEGNGAGYDVSDAGDLNADGFADLVVGAPGADDGGAAYVIFGTDQGFGAPDGERQVLDLTGLSAGAGLIIQAHEANDSTGFSVSSAKDVNGDGINDLVVAAAGEGQDSLEGSEVYVIFGAADGLGETQGGQQILDLTDLSPSEGFLIRGDAPYQDAAHSVAGLGDINGDGLGDVAFGAPGVGPRSGEAYVIYGSDSGFGSSDEYGRSLIDVTNFTPDEGFVIRGDDNGAEVGFDISTAGDINGDGFADLMVSAPESDVPGPATGEVYVLFGGDDGFGAPEDGRQVVDVSALSWPDGFVIEGADERDKVGYDISAAGDVNGDGFDDLIVGSHLGDDGGSGAGEAYVVFGDDGLIGDPTRGRRVLDLSDLTSDKGIVIRGEVAGDNLGYSVSGAGDVNGDGFADLIVAAHKASPSGEKSGQAYLVFGSSRAFELDEDGRQVLDLSEMSAGQGVEILGDAPFDRLGWSASAAGDINNDGYDDIVIGAQHGDDGGVNAGEAYVIYGGLHFAAGDAPVISLESLAPEAGFVVQTPGAGNSLAGGGDFNDDGVADFIIGGVAGEPGGGAPGGSYVIFGGNTSLGAIQDGRQVFDPSMIDASEGFFIRGETSSDSPGESVASLGDVNGDGIDDILMGAPNARVEGGQSSGEAYVVFGSDSGFGSDLDGRQTLDLLNLDASEGFIIESNGYFHGLGLSTANAGDINGDGFDDIIIGSRGDYFRETYAGESYVVFGTDQGFGVDSDGRQILNTASLDGETGLAIHGEDSYDSAGQSVSGGGDVNGDGFDDLVVGARGLDAEGPTTGGAYVIFGKSAVFGSNADGQQIFDLGGFSASDGFLIQGDAQGDQAGYKVSITGDINQDGFDDILLSAWFGDDNGEDVGEAYIVYGADQGFGQPDGNGQQIVDLSTLTQDEGLIIRGREGEMRTGQSLSNAGDVNGDGYGDLLIGAPRPDDSGDLPGVAFLVFGSEAGLGAVIDGQRILDLSDLQADEGVVFTGPDGGRAGESVAAAGDINQDGFDDILIGAQGAGEAYVIYGRADFTPVAAPETAPLTEDMLARMAAQKAGAPEGGASSSAPPPPERALTDHSRDFSAALDAQMAEIAARFGDGPDDAAAFDALAPDGFDWF